MRRPVKLTVAQAAAALGLHPSWVRELCRCGRLPATCEETPRGRVWWIAPADVEAWKSTVTERNAGKKGRKFTV